MSARLRSTSDHRAATRGPLRAGWRRVCRANAWLGRGVFGDILGGIALTVMTVTLIWGAGLAQAVWP